MLHHIHSDEKCTKTEYDCLKFGIMWQMATASWKHGVFLFVSCLFIQEGGPIFKVFHAAHLSRLINYLQSSLPLVVWAIVFIKIVTAQVCACCTWLQSGPVELKPGRSRPASEVLCCVCVFSLVWRKSVTVWWVWPLNHIIPFVNKSPYFFPHISPHFFLIPEWKLTCPPLKPSWHVGRSLFWTRSTAVVVQEFGGGCSLLSSLLITCDNPRYSHPQRLTWRRLVVSPFGHETPLAFW